MKFGFDIHGVVDKDPLIFSSITKQLILDGHEIHILTGHQITGELKKKLFKLNITWNKLFSIVDYHLSIGTEVDLSDAHNPRIEENLWNKTKGIYCLENNINLHVDDSLIYGNSFSTPYCHYDHKVKKFSFNYKMVKHGEFTLGDPMTAKNVLIGVAEYLLN